MSDQEFIEFIWQQAGLRYRDMPWRRDTQPYYVLTSELMLQQTQVGRVIPKFEAFIARFEDVASLASAELGEVIRYWQGLGYNRRAKYLHDSARAVVSRYAGVFPSEQAGLLSLPGVGVNTAGAIRAYAFNQPAIFVETNIRTVYIHHFFDDAALIDDAAIKRRLEATLDTEHPREFYWALMDYGSYLKSQGIRTNARSQHYSKQPPLEGSLRQMRGRIVRELSKADLSKAALYQLFKSDERIAPALEGLVRDGLVSATDGAFHLTK